MFGRQKRVVPRGVELVSNRGEFRPGLYDRDIHELRTTLSTIEENVKVVVANQTGLDELMRKVGLVMDRDTRAVERAAKALFDLQEIVAKLEVNINSLTQVLANVKEEVVREIRERLDEAVNQLVASHQDVVGQLRKVTDKTRTNEGGETKRQPSSKDQSDSTEQARCLSTDEREFAAELRQVIGMIAAGESGKAAEALSAIYGRLDILNGATPQDLDSRETQTRGCV